MKQEDPGQMTKVYKSIIRSVPEALRGPLSGSNSCPGVWRKLREDLTKEEKEKLEKYGVIEFKSAGAIRQR